MDLILTPAAVETKSCLLDNIGFSRNKISGKMSGFTQQKITLEVFTNSSMLVLFFICKTLASKNFFLSISYDDIFKSLSFKRMPFIIALDIFPNPINPISDICILYTLSRSKNFCSYSYHCRSFL